MLILIVVKQPDNDKEAGNLHRTVSITGKKDQGKLLENIATMLFVGTEVSCSYRCSCLPFIGDMGNMLLCLFTPISHFESKLRLFEKQLKMDNQKLVIKYYIEVLL